MMKAGKYNSNYCREVAEKFCINLDNIDANDVFKLHRILSKHILNSDCFDDTFYMESPKKSEVKLAGKNKGVFLTCSAYYFNRREAVSFNGDGFIGFCGWADSYNSQPIYEGFLEWCEYIRKTRSNREA